MIVLTALKSRLGKLLLTLPPLMLILSGASCSTVQPQVPYPPPNLMAPAPQSLETVPLHASLETERLVVVRNYRAYHLIRLQLTDLQNWVRENFIEK